MGLALKKAPRRRAGVAALFKERLAIQERLHALDRQTPLPHRAGITGDNTPASDPLDEMQASLATDLGLMAREILGRRLKALARAQRRIREGTYGICVACGKPIPPARLRAVPEAAHCVPCAETEEGRLRRIR